MSGLFIKCLCCDEQITYPGALLFSPPDEDDKCIKDHLCVSCFEEVQSVLFTLKSKILKKKQNELN